ncbi:hypothetical protein FOPG_18289 [Fusarium oxysporum f. sp. conglutinans race 2 54008]|uniref:Uncharacterized protein n=1 Tax=Fusarium oxysporum f. sp. conglutinans race 2 54008 TaxID=1089457 RepID=X0H039_FUSOX|nr:hypothetical protein FOPG_18289 [Fusarium oxysporum f. sp. conglutinans race 2 54008]
MAVSKWLTFGHVLFSDVRHELVPVEGSLKRHPILVIYGLGNDDWPFYTAETYVHLGSTVDLIVRLLGKGGFTTIKAARVGVSIASSVTRSDSKADKGKAAAEKKNNPPSLS